MQFILSCALKKNERDRYQYYSMLEYIDKLQLLHGGGDVLVGGGGRAVKFCVNWAVCGLAHDELLTM